MKKQYGDVTSYEAKLERVMSRLGVQSFDYNFDRHGCWVEFRYKNELYRFEHSVEKAKERGVKLQYGSDCFSQVVLSLEDLARMVERGIYDLSSWIAGMKFLPPAPVVPEFFRALGFEAIPGDVVDVKERYRSLAKQKHPDAGGSDEDFKQLTEASELAIKYFTDRG